MATGGINLSKEFFEILKAIGESKSKQEEDRIITREVTVLKKKLESRPPGGSPYGGSSGGIGGSDLLLSSKKRAKEFLVRLLYVEMLGHDGSFGYIKAVEMAASASLSHKRTGYLVCSACLSPSHEFRFMLVNQMQRDLQSTNILEICGGLLASTCLITEDMVPAVASEVGKLINHDSDTVRKKAIIAYHRFHQLAPETVTKKDVIDKLRKVLCDKDPAVMGSSLNVIESMSNQDAHAFKDLIPSLVSILKQIGEHRLPSDFDYHRVPAPWIQMKLIRILAILGQADANASSGMYEILADTMSKADVGVNAGYAVVYECIKTIATIYPNAKLLDAAGEAISRFIISRSHNLKYLGVTGLAMIVETNPQYAAQHQIAVMDCLQDSDETLQRKTLDLLYRMTNPVNVEFITDNMLCFLRETHDTFLKNVLTTRVCSVAERYAPNNAWYIKTITMLFQLTGDMVPQQVAQNLMSLIAEGDAESSTDQEDMLLRQNAVEIYVHLLQENQKTHKFIPRILLETMSWCLGEYGYLSKTSNIQEILQALCNVAKTSNQTKLLPTTRKFILNAIMKLIAQAGQCPQYAASVIDDFTKSKDVDLQQRCLEFQNILTNCPQVLAETLPVDASAEDIQVDPNLNFLHNFVQQSLDNGSRPYEPPEDDDDLDDFDISYSAAGKKKNEPAFKMTPYEKPTKPTHNVGGINMKGMGSGGMQSTTPGVPLPPGGASNNSSFSVAGDDPSNASGGVGGIALNTRNVNNVWGRGGLTGAAAAKVSPKAVSAATATATATIAESTTAATSNGGYGADYGGGFSSSAAPVQQELPKTKEQLEKERMAAALFGGIVPGAEPIPPPSRASAAPVPAASLAPAPAPPAPALPPAAPVAGPEIDLLDMGSFDVPAPAPATGAGAAPTDFDVLSPTPLPATTSSSPKGHYAAISPPTVETVDTEEEGDAFDTTQATNSNSSEQQQQQKSSIDDDPFASVTADLTDAPLQSTGMSMMGAGGMSPVISKFEFQGSPMEPAVINTAQFGQQWGQCTAASPLNIITSKVNDLQSFMSICSQIGAHPVEAIATTNEGICAGIINKSAIALFHGKITPLPQGSTKIDVTVRSADISLSSSLAMYLQTMLR